MATSVEYKRLRRSQIKVSVALVEDAWDALWACVEAMEYFGIDKARRRDAEKVTSRLLRVANRAGKAQEAKNAQAD